MPIQYAEAIIYLEELLLKKLLVALKGMIIGGTMMVPGVSGGSMAMILGIYDELITSVSSFLKHKMKSLIFLLIFVAGALAGMLLFANPLDTLMKKYPLILMYFFMGAVAGSIPMMLRKAQIGKTSANSPPNKKAVKYAVVVLCLAAGVAVVFLLELLPEGLFSLENNSISFYLMQLLAGIIAAVALVLPGISVSHMLLMLGLLEPIYDILKSGFSTKWFSLIPLAVGLLAGVILTTRILELSMKNHPTPTYSIILGFLIGSIIDVFPGLPTGLQIPLCLGLFVVGFALIFILSKIEEKNENEKLTAEN